MEENQLQRLILRYLSKETSPDEESELLDWLANDPANLVIFKEWQNIWSKARISSPEYNFPKALDKLNKTIDASEAARQRFSWTKIAASVTVLLVVGFAAYFAASNFFVNENVYSFKQVSTIPGKKTTITLLDGSIVILNVNSSLRYPERFADNRREVFLSGEAFFQISKDVERPFVIHSGDIQTEVLGTSFNVKSTKDFVTVSVATGKVKVSSENASKIILPNEKVVYEAGPKNIIKMTADLERELAWKNNTLIFEDAQLSRVAEKLHEFYGVSVMFEKEALKKCYITGKFINQPIETVLQAITFSTGVKYQMEGNKIILSGSGCE